MGLAGSWRVTEQIEVFGQVFERFVPPRMAARPLGSDRGLDDCAADDALGKLGCSAASDPVRETTCPYKLCAGKILQFVVTGRTQLGFFGRRHSFQCLIQFGLGIALLGLRAGFRLRDNDCTL
ncbi:hypothetical protein [Hoeflea sp.]|uniref:hypothetical protein n=1 Tax=Hoeflea sp. TaxID=1940281 RepID=UPI003B012EB1